MDAGLESVLIAWEEWDLEVEPEKKSEMRRRFERAVHLFIDEKQLRDGSGRSMSFHDFRYFAREIYAAWRRREHK
ncbi:MAG TPA: hypothetical protein VGO11_27305 [Chthoniobacteraceae bacterium]|jgi:hypothetical protein|nr:hypothetical protein [Chthoniobacteraceae bacterium]